MKDLGNIKILFIAGFGPIVADAAASQKFYRQILGISFKEEDGGYLHTGDLPGAKSFALWPLPHAAQSCFGKDTWPSEYPVPQAWLEFDVENVEAATEELEAKGYQVLLKNKKNPGAKPSRACSARKAYYLGSPSRHGCAKENEIQKPAERFRFTSLQVCRESVDLVR